LPATQVYARYRGVTSEPGAWLPLRGESLKVLSMSDASESRQIEVGRIVLAQREVWLGTATHALKLDTVQPAGRSAMKAEDWFRGLQNSESVYVDDV